MDENFLRYNALDAACTLEIWNAIEHDLSDDGFSVAYDLTVRLFPVLMFMQTRGIAVDQAALEQTRLDVRAKAVELQEQLDKHCGRHLNVNSPKDCKQYFFIELGIEPYISRDGKISVDDLTLQRLARGTVKRPGLPEAKLIQDIRGLNKLYSTYLAIEFDEDSRMRCSFNPRGTKFGRLSSSKTIHGTGTNFQNLPQEFKKFLVADPGYVMFEVDKRQAEWVVVAFASGDANMLSAIEQGIDVHAHTASLMFNAPVELIKAENKLIGHTNDPDQIAEIRKSLLPSSTTWPRTMSARQAGKKSNHGLNYDEGYRNFALINEIDEREAKRMVELYHKIYPGIRLWYEYIKRQLREDRSLTNCFGRKVRFMEAYNDQLFKSAYSMIPQSTVVDSLNLGMVEIYADELLTRMLNIDILAQVHDSILMQIPVSELNEEIYNRLTARINKLTSPEMEYGGRKFKIETDWKWGWNWGEQGKMNASGMRELHSWHDLQTMLEMGRDSRAE